VRADRLVSLVLLLQARGRMTARELAGELGVSVRTVYRDLDGLSAAGVPVLAEAGPGGGCRLLDDYRFPLRALRPGEAEALLILGVPDVLCELGLDGAVAAAQRQIRVSSGLDRGAGAAGPPAALVHLDMPRWFHSHEPVPYLRDLAAALRQQRRLRLCYPRGGGDPVARVVAPLGLVNKAGIWYLVAQAGHGRILVFRAGRITAAQALDQPADRPPGFDLAGFWQRWSQEFQASRPRLRVRLRASPHALAVFGEVFGDAAAAALGAALPPGEDGWRELTLWFEHEPAAAHRLAGFGAQVQVLSPPAVREQLLATARGILDRYGAAPAPASGSARTGGLPPA
jgi:predicted DNA-binding transcriptional regulator YafY